MVLVQFARGPEQTRTFSQVAVWLGSDSAGRGVAGTLWRRRKACTRSTITIMTFGLLD